MPIVALGMMSMVADILGITDLIRGLFHIHIRGYSETEKKLFFLN